MPYQRYEILIDPHGPEWALDYVAEPDGPPWALVGWALMETPGPEWALDYLKGSLVGPSGPSWAGL